MRLMDTWTHLDCSMKIEKWTLSDASSSRATKKNLSASSSIQWTRLNDDNELVINMSRWSKIEMRPLTMPKFLYKLTCWRKNCSWIFQTNKYVETTQSWNLLFSTSSRIIFTFEECLKSRFGGESQTKSPLERWNSFSKLQNKKPLIWQLIGSFWARLWVRLRVFLLIFLHVVYILMLNGRLIKLQIILDFLSLQERNFFLDFNP